MNAQTFQPVEEGVRDFTRLDIEPIEALRGARITRFSSPGEAVADFEETYIDSHGIILAQTLWGDFGQERGRIDATIGSKKLVITLLSSKDCEEKIIPYEEHDSDTYRAPQTMILGLAVNGREFRTQQPLTAECNVGYGDSISDPMLEKPEFNGTAITFRLLGYQVMIPSSGVVDYTRDPIYRVNGCGRQENPLSLVYEDETGIHEVEKNIWTDQALELLGDGYYCFPYEKIDAQNRQAIFTIEDHYRNTEEQEIGTLTYDISKGVFLKPILD